VHTLVTRLMKNLFLVLLLSTTVQLSHAQVADGIYVVPGANVYSAVISNGDIIKGYLFSLEDGRWETISGSRIGDTVEFVSNRDTDTAAAKVVGGPLGVTTEYIYCTPDRNGLVENSEGCKYRSTTPIKSLPVIKANGALKAIYTTQWGADMLLFDSDGIAVILIFENGDDDRAWIGAYTASISDDLAIFNLETVVETDSEDDEDDVLLSFELQLSDLINPQASFANVTCEEINSDDQGLTCDQLAEVYLSKLVRVF